MGAVKVKILETDAGTLVSVDSRPAYDTGNTAKKEQNNLNRLFKILGVENVEIEAKEVK